MGRNNRRNRGGGGGNNRRNNRKNMGASNSRKKGKGRNRLAEDDTVESVVANGNFKMEAYYAAQGLHDTYWTSAGDNGENDDDGDAPELVPCTTPEQKEAERRRWRDIIGKTLPASFRIGRDTPSKLRQRMESELEEWFSHKKQRRQQHPNGEDGTAANDTKELTSEDHPQQREEDEDGQGAAADTSTASTPSSTAATTAPIHKIGFMEHAYQLGYDRSTIRKNPGLVTLHEWLKRQTSSGFISRQETVSMIPPVVLDVQPNDAVFDMCAAPGSKTTQMLEALGPEGVLIANDANSSRAHMLVHQIRRIMHNNPVCVVTNCYAQQFPNLDGKQFDKILCDVPCSGDATSRKNIGVWKKWSQLASWGLHPLQIDIGWKGIQLLQVGGYMCYSTCSFNPSENEAVVAELLRRGNGKLELVPCRELLKNFKTRPGWSSWKVFCETKSRRKMKDEYKKTNRTMQQRKQQYQEERKHPEQAEEPNGPDSAAQAAVGADGTVEHGQVTGNEEPASAGDDCTDGNGSISAATPDAAIPEVKDANGPDGLPLSDGSMAVRSEQNAENAELIADNERTFLRKFQPESMDEDTLIETVKLAGMQHFKSLEDVPDALRSRLRRTCFPPTREEADRLHLDRCIRCLPHDNDTGGFFIALLKKTAPISARDRRNVQESAEKQRQEPPSKEKEAQKGATTNNDIITAEPEPKRAKLRQESEGVNSVDGDVDIEDKEGDCDDEDIEVDLDGIDEDNRPVIGRQGRSKAGKDGRNPDDFVPVDAKLLDPLVKYYGLASSPTFRKDLYMTRAGGDSKIIYYIAKPVKELIDLGLQERVTCVNSGLKGFVRNNKECAVGYRSK